jgi:hypothetical protein
MGLDDEAEKLRQAEEWFKDGKPEQQKAALDHVGHVLATSQRRDLRSKAWKLLHRMEARDKAL